MKTKARSYWIFTLVCSAVSTGFIFLAVAIFNYLLHLGFWPVVLTIGIVFAVAVRLQTWLVKKEDF